MTILKEAGLVAHREIGRKKAAAKYKSSIGSFYEKSWKDKATTIPQTRTKIKQKKKKMVIYIRTGAKCAQTEKTSARFSSNKFIVNATLWTNG
ncbi:hypothetical protein [Cytobacillus horneckiae]|uniref:hypothetical protein n=1 Tax=Cytobacillus horneckiae TaxID=549687 RepID=UPI0034CFA496